MKVPSFGPVALSALALLVAPTVGHAQDRFLDSNGVRIRYVDHGHGEPVVLLHGLGSRLESWTENGVLPNLAKDHRVIAFDLRGHGKSGKPHDAKSYGPEMALDVVRLMESLGIQKAHIVGYSLGAQVTAQLLTLHPERFLTATLGGEAGRFDPDGPAVRSAEAVATEFERECISRTLVNGLDPASATPSEEEFKKRSAACFADPTIDRFALAAQRRGIPLQLITPDEVRAVSVPTLAVVGALDSSLSSFRELVRLRPSVKLVVIEGAPHGGPRGASRRPEFVAAVREFIDAAKKPASSR